MNEGTYVPEWLHVLHHTTNDYQTRWEKLFSFRHVHHELLTVVNLCLSDEFALLGHGNPLEVSDLPPWRKWKRIYRRDDPGSRITVDLDWKVKPDSENGKERLYWIVGPQKSADHVARNDFGGKMTRYKTMEAWTEQIYIDAREHWTGIPADFKKTCANEFMDRNLDEVLLEAPRGVNREEAKNHYCAAFARVMTERRQ